MLCKLLAGDNVFYAQRQRVFPLPLTPTLRMNQTVSRAACASVAFDRGLTRGLSISVVWWARLIASEWR